MSCQKSKFQYFPIRARNVFPTLIATYGGIEMNVESVSDWGTLKPTTPFLQLPLLTLEDGTVISQSMTIVRYLAREANLEGEGKDYIINSMVVESTNDIYDLLSAAKNKIFWEDITAAYDKIFTEEGRSSVIQQLNCLEKLKSDSDYFGSKVLIGDLTLFSVLFTIELDLFEKEERKFDLLDKFPKVNKWYGNLKSDEKVQKWIKEISSNFTYFKYKE